jgi:outer membrane protein assembly factor BamB
MKRIPTLVLILCACFVSMAWSQQPADKGNNGWSEFHRHNMQRRNPYEKVLNVNNVGNLHKKWSYTTGSDVESSPAVANGVVYVGSEDGNVYALKASTGANVSALPRSPLFSITRSLFSPRVCVSRYQAVTTPGKVFSGDPDFRTRLSVP